MQQDVTPKFAAESAQGLSPAEPPEEPQPGAASRLLRVRLRLRAIWEGSRCALDAEPGAITEARQAVLECSGRGGAVEIGGRFLDAPDRPPPVRFPLPAADPDRFWREVWGHALTALTGRLARQIERRRREQPEADPLPAGALLDDCLGAEEVVDVFLPFLKRTEPKAASPGADPYLVQVDEFHRVEVRLAESPAAQWERANFQQAALLLAGALPRPAAPQEPAPALRFADVRRLTAPQLRCNLPRLLAGCGLAAPVPLSALEADESGPEAEVSIALHLPSADASPFFEAPRQRSPEYYEAFGQVSLAIQRALRAWLPYMLFSEPDRYGDFETAYPMLAYQAGRPFLRKGSPEFTYDVMNPESVQRALRSASSPLAELLQSAAALLAACGREAIAHRYRRLEPKALLEAVKRSPRAFQSLLAAEACFVEEIIKFALEARLLREEPAEAPRRLYRLVAQFTESLHQRLRRLYRGLSAVSLGSLVLLEASQALSRAHGTPAPLEALLRLRFPSGKEIEWALVRPQQAITDAEAGRL